LDNTEKFLYLKSGYSRLFQLLIISPEILNKVKVSKNVEMIKFYLPLWDDDELLHYCRDDDVKFKKLKGKKIPHDILFNYKNVFNSLHIDTSELTYSDMFGILVRFLLENSSLTEFEYTLMYMSTVEFFSY
jgi:hypothetical protein